MKVKYMTIEFSDADMKILLEVLTDWQKQNENSALSQKYFVKDFLRVLPQLINLTD